MSFDAICFRQKPVAAIMRHGVGCFRDSESQQAMGAEDTAFGKAFEA